MKLVLPRWTRGKTRRKLGAGEQTMSKVAQVLVLFLLLRCHAMQDHERQLIEKQLI